MHFEVIRRDEKGNKLVRFPDGKIGVLNKNNLPVNTNDSEKFLKRKGFKTKRNGKKLKVENGRFIGQFKANQKGLINMDSLDELARF